MSFQPPLNVVDVNAIFPNRFASIQPVYAGGQGSVFKVRESANHSSVLALKFYYADQLEERTVREIEAMQKIKSDVIVELMESGTVSVRSTPCKYVATKFIEGSPLCDLLKVGALKVEQVAKIGRDLAGAVEELWNHRIVHRDIKPPNIMVRKDGSAVLIDLGIARHLSLGTLTTAGKTWGTEGYMSPEHARARKSLTCKTDVFSLGIVLQECLAGKHPTNSQQYLMIGGPRTESLVKGLPPKLNTLLNAMVNLDPLVRPLPQTIQQELEPLI